MSKVTNITFAGVGGQGILLACEMTAAVLLTADFDVKQSEIHGMSQRGGSVTSDLRFGGSVCSPLIPEGETDILVAFEKLEGLRALPCLKPEGIAVVNDESILPVGCALDDYPADTLERIAARSGRCIVIKANELAEEAGNARAANMALVGVLSTILPVEEHFWTDAIRTRFSGRIADINEKAFGLGRACRAAAVAG